MCVRERERVCVRVLESGIMRGLRYASSQLEPQSCVQLIKLCSELSLDLVRSNYSVLPSSLEAILFRTSRWAQKKKGATSKYFRSKIFPFWATSQELHILNEPLT